MHGYSSRRGHRQFTKGIHGYKPEYIAMYDDELVFPVGEDEWEYSNFAATEWESVE